MVFSMEVGFSEEKYTEMIEKLFLRFPSFQKAGASAYKPGIQNMEMIDQLMGHPHRSYKIIHVAGTNGKGSVYGSFSKTIKDGLITCSTAGYSVGGDGNKTSSTSFRAFVISVSGLSSSSGNMEVAANSCYIENTTSGVVWVYDEGPACDFN
jgi:hypothetical protein